MGEIITFKCRNCEEELPLSEFNHSSKNKNKIQAYCKKCSAAKAIEFLQKNSDRRKKYQEKWLQNSNYKKPKNYKIKTSRDNTIAKILRNKFVKDSFISFLSCSKTEFQKYISNLLEKESLNMEDFLNSWTIKNTLNYHEFDLSNEDELKKYFHYTNFYIKKYD